MLRATHGHLASKNENKRQKNIGRWFEVMTTGTTDKAALYWYDEPSVLTHKSWCGDYTRTRAHELHACNTHTNTCTHATLTRTHAAMHARNTHTHTRTHAQVLNLHVHAHTSGPDRHIHNQVIPAHRLESCRACINLCLSDLFLMRTDRWDPQGMCSCELRACSSCACVRVCIITTPAPVC